MRIAIPKEIKSDEARIAILPVGAELLIKDGHEVYIQQNAGTAAGYPDEAYAAVGATILPSAQESFETADLILKVKEPQPEEISMIRPGQLMFTYFHLAASEELTTALMKSGVSAIAYETLVDANGTLPLLTPMSEVAGKLSVQAGAQALENPYGGRGVLLGGVTGVAPAQVVVLGAGIVGINAARMAAGLDARVTLMDINLDKLRELGRILPANVHTRYCDPHAIEDLISQADLFIGAVLLPGARAPKLIKKSHLDVMRPGAAIVDVCIDQGGCAETSKPTTHQDPTYTVDGIVHYCVANMPGAVANTSTQALCNATLPYVRQLAGKGLDSFLNQSPGHAAALNLRDGQITHPAVKEAFPHL